MYLLGFYLLNEFLVDFLALQEKPFLWKSLKDEVRAIDYCSAKSKEFTFIKKLVNDL